MKASIIKNVKIRQKHLDEVKELIPDILFDIEDTTYSLVPKWNPYLLDIWANFDLMRALFLDKTDIRCFVTSQAELIKINITSHIGMYDATDNDSVVDFYIGIPEKLDARAIKNGFKSNFAWLFIHEMLHGKELLARFKDRTHAMEEQGRLKELLAEHLERDRLIERFNLLQIVFDLTLKLKNLIWNTKN